MVNDHLDAQTSSRLLKRALAIKGGREQLAGALGVQAEDLAPWLAGKAFPPEPIFENVLEIVLDGSQPVSRPAASGTRKPRVLVAESAEAHAVLARILSEDFTLVPVETFTEGLDLLQSSAARRMAFDAIVCGQHFDGSQMLRFLECVKAYKPTSAIPFIGCRVVTTQLRDSALGAMREACEALGAIAYIDLTERQHAAGAEKAAVEFRDAVSAAVRMKSPERSLRILVVDDNADAAHTLAALLRMAGHNVQKASGGEEALRVGAEFKPDAAVLDIGMSDMSGYALAQRIRDEGWGGGVMLVAVTGSDDTMRAREAGFAHHLMKPVKVEHLLEALRQQSSYPRR